MKKKIQTIETMDIVVFTRQIQEKIETLKATIASVNAENSGIGIDDDDAAIADNIASRMVSTRTTGILKEKCRKLELVLRRIDAGDPDYGYCAECGEPIPVERLLAVPESEYCVDCANMKG